MKPRPDNHDDLLDEKDPVWQLLARAPRQEPDAWFTARTLARCRRVGQQVEKGWAPVGRVWRWALGGGLGVCLAAILMVSQMQIHTETTAPANQKGVQEAFEVVANLGGAETDSSPTSSTWQDSSL